MQNATHKLHSEHNENGELQLTISIPVKKDQEADGLTIAQVRAISCDILGSFSKRIIASLERRMSACMEKLMNHFDTAFTYPYGGQIFYRAKNNRELGQIYKEIDKLEKSKLNVRQYSRRYEAYQPFALAAVIALLLEILFRITIFRRIP